MIKVSVCIPTYNHGLYIAQAIEGALMQQTDFSFEIVIGEDDSTDSTRSIVIDYAKRYPAKIRLFLNDRKNVIFINGRPSGRWNLINLLKQAGGQYIALCEGDDYWTDASKLQKQVDFLDANPEYAGAFHETEVITESGVSPRVYGRGVPDTLSAVDTIAVQSPFHTSSFVFRNNDCAYPDWFTRVFSGDMALFSIVAAKGPIKKIPGIMSVYRKHQGGITNTPEALATYHEQRVELITYLNEYHAYKFATKAQETILRLGARKQRKRRPGFLCRLRSLLKIRSRIQRLLPVR